MTMSDDGSNKKNQIMSTSFSRVMRITTTTIWMMMMASAPAAVVESFQTSARRRTTTTTTTEHHHHPESSSITSRIRPFFSTMNKETETASTTSAAAKKKMQTDDEEALSDVDTRVLQSMLQDSKLDLQSEDNVRKLLERGTKKKVTTPPPKEDNEDSVFSSKLFQKMTDTKLWKKLSAQTADTLESIGIWVGNKVEQDLKTLLALGLFGWERAVRDVARALPETRTVAKKTVMLLTNSSSWQDPESTRALGPAGSSTASTSSNLAEELQRPADEIKAVSREVMGILSGQQRSSTGRGLRTAAPAGINNSAERQRRAYRQRRRVDRRNQDVTRIAGSVVDQAWELRREIASETNQPGYKTEPIRNAIEAGVVGTGNLLKSVQEKAKLSAAQRKETRRLQQARAEALPTYPTLPALVQALQEERVRVAANLQGSIQDPSTSWLSVDVIDSSGDDVVFDEDHLRAVVEKLVLLRGEIRNQDVVFAQEQQSPTESLASLAVLLLQDLLEIQAGINDICQEASRNLSAVVAMRLREQLFGTNENDDVSLSSQEQPPLIMLVEAGMEPVQFLQQQQQQEQQQDPSSATAEAVVTPNGAADDDDVTTTVNGFSSSSTTDNTADDGHAETFVASPQTTADVLDVTADSRAAFFVDRPASPIKKNQKKKKKNGVTAAPAEAVVIEPEAMKNNNNNNGAFSGAAPAEVQDVSFADSRAVFTTTDMIDDASFAVEDNNVVVTPETQKDDGMAGYRGVVAEIISDNDFDTAFAERDVTMAQEVLEGEDEENNKEPNPAAEALLRSLDIAVFVVEKVFVAGVPQTLVVADTAMKRLNDVSKNGQGSAGWTQIKGLGDSKGRY